MDPQDPTNNPPGQNAPPSPEARPPTQKVDEATGPEEPIPESDAFDRPEPLDLDELVASLQKSDPLADAGGEPSGELFFKVGRVRRSFGYVLMIAAFASMGALGVWSLLGIDGISSLNAKGNTEPLELLLVKSGAHAIITLALVWFGYQMLKAGERLILPHWYAEKSIGIGKLFLGIQEPAKATMKQLEKVTDALSTVVRPVAKAADKLVDKAAERIGSKDH
jgi:hypothetical protein